MTKKLIIALVSLIVLVGGGIGVFTLMDDSSSSTDEDTKTIVTTLFPYYSYLEASAGDDIDIEFVGNGDPHDFEPTPQDIVTITNADLIVFNGGIDEWMHDVVESEGISADKVVEIIESLDEDSLIGSGGHSDHDDDHDSEKDENHSDGEDHDHDEGHSDEDHDHSHIDTNADFGIDLSSKKEDEDDHSGHDHGAYDPHLWVSPASLVPALEIIQEKVEDTFGDDADGESAEANLATLKELNQQYSSNLSSCDRGLMVVSHRFLEYVARDYSLNAISVRNEEDGEATIEDIKEVIEIIDQNQLTKILVDSQNLSAEDLLGSDVSVEAVVFNNMEAFTADDHSETPLDAILRDNLSALENVLSCQTQ